MASHVRCVDVGFQESGLSQDNRRSRCTHCIGFCMSMPTTERGVAPRAARAARAAQARARAQRSARSAAHGARSARSAAQRAQRAQATRIRTRHMPPTWRTAHVVAGLSLTERWAAIHGRCVSTFKFFQKWRQWTKITLCTNLFWTGKFRSFIQRKHKEKLDDSPAWDRPHLR